MWRAAHSPREPRARNLARLEGMPLAVRAVAIERDGRVLATGSPSSRATARLFDIVTHGEARRQWPRPLVVAGLLRVAGPRRRHAYLQVGRATSRPAAVPAVRLRGALLVTGTRGPGEQE